MQPIASPIQTLLDLFSTALADVRFADVDAQTLDRIASEVHAAAAVVVEAEAALDRARAVLQERQDALLTHAQRALAYARVYAEGDETLSARLDAVSLPRAAKRAARGDEALVLTAEPQPSPRPRGRPRKVAIAELAQEALVSPAE